MSPAGLESDFIRIKNQVRELVRRGALESAASLNWAQWRIANRNPAPAQADRRILITKPAARPARRLVLYLPFDTPDVDGIVRDASGAGNDGRVYGATWVPEGKFGGAYQFSITNLTDRIVVPNSDSLEPGLHTVTAWIKTADTDGFWNRIVDKDFVMAIALTSAGIITARAHGGNWI